MLVPHSSPTYLFFLEMDELSLASAMNAYHGESASDNAPARLSLCFYSEDVCPWNKMKNGCSRPHPKKSEIQPPACKWGKNCRFNEDGRCVFTHEILDLIFQKNSSLISSLMRSIMFNAWKRGVAVRQPEANTSFIAVF